MKKTFRKQLWMSVFVSSTVMAFCLAAMATPQTGQTSAAQPSATPAASKPDSDITRRELRNFDRYLDNHPEVAEQVRKDPSLVNNEDWMEKHPELREFLKNHPGVKDELKENPQAFVNRERRFEKNGGDINRTELRNFDKYLDSHPEVAEQVRKNPSLVNNEDWMEKHPELQEFLKNHPRARQDLKEHPNAFMKRENRYDRREGEQREERAERAASRTKKQH